MLVPPLPLRTPVEVIVLRGVIPIRVQGDVGDSRATRYRKAGWTGMPEH